MTVGRVDNMSYMNYISAAGRVVSPAMRSAAQNVSPVGSSASSGAPVNNAVQNLNGLFYSFDGDSAEISKRAGWLSNSQPEQSPGGTGVITNYQFDLPSPLIDWNKIAFESSAPPVIAPPSVNIPTNSGPSGGKPPEIPGTGLLESLEPQGECYTCANRKYVDQSDDASVSFQTPTKVSPNMAAAAVASHESEHVRNEQAKAQRDDREIVSQTVTLTYDCCPECGRNYVSGGTTRTTSVSKSDSGAVENAEDQPQQSD